MAIFSRRRQHAAATDMRDMSTDRAQMTTTQRLIGTFALIVLVLSITSGTLVYWLSQSYTEQESLQRASDVRAAAISVSDAINGEQAGVLRTLWTDTASGNAAFVVSRNLLDDNLRVLQTQPGSVATPERVTALRTATDNLTRFLTNILDLQQRGNPEQARQMWQSQERLLSESATDKADTLRILSESAAVKVRETGLQERGTAITAIIIAAIVAIVLLVAALWNIIFTLRSLIRARRVAEDRVQALTTATGEITSRQRQNAATGAEVRAVVTQLSATAQQQAEATEVQAREVVTVVAAASELNEAAHQIAGRAQSVADRARAALSEADGIVTLAQQTDRTAERGQQAVIQTVTGIEATAQSIGTLRSRLDALTDQSQRIDAILRLITDIADQIHLLALNAAIEAAGTPDGLPTGERFGVVANEIRQLADRTVSAVAETGTMTRAVQQAIQQALRAAAASTSATSEAVALAHAAGETIDHLRALNSELAEAVRHIRTNVAAANSLNAEIDGATRLQERAGADIVHSMEALTDLAQATAQAITQLAATTDHLGTLSNQLVGDLNQSLVTHDPPQPPHTPALPAPVIALA